MREGNDLNNFSNLDLIFCTESIIEIICIELINPGLK